MDFLSPSLENCPSNGWVACTTDDILADKNQLYDTLITLPPMHSAQAKEKVWPTIKPSSSEPVTTDIKATQRDLRRYRTLRRELRSFTSSNAGKSSYPSKASSNGTMNAALSTEYVSEPSPNDDDAYSTHSAQVTEPQSWSALAYNSFMWWASAGENRTDMDEEEEGDAALLLRQRAESPGKTRLSKSPGRGGGGMDGEDVGGTPGRAGGGGGSSCTSVEMSIIAYFHRFTAMILKTLADIVDAADTDDLDVEPSDVDAHAPADNDGAAASTVRSNAAADGEGRAAEGLEGTTEVVVESEDMARMGLDVWSESDREFVKGLVALYWGRRCGVKGGRFDVCGVRLC